MCVYLYKQKNENKYSIVLKIVEKDRRRKKQVCKNEIAIF